MTQNVSLNKIEEKLRLHMHEHFVTGLNRNIHLDSRYLDKVIRRSTQRQDKLALFEKRKWAIQYLQDLQKMDSNNRFFCVYENKQIHINI